VVDGGCIATAGWRVRGAGEGVGLGDDTSSGKDSEVEVSPGESRRTDQGVSNTCKLLLMMGSGSLETVKGVGRATMRCAEGRAP
jgi:hypothetical protein